MQGKSDLKLPILQASLAGCAAVGLYITYKFFNAENEVSGISDPSSKEGVINQVMTQLKKELRENHPIIVPRDQDGFPTKEFFLELHGLIYKYKLYGQDMIGEANTHRRLHVLEEIEDLKEQAKQTQS